MKTEQKTIKTVLNYYHFDVRKEGEKALYAELRENLRAAGLRCFETLGFQKQSGFRSLNGREIELETEFVFGDQWNTAPIGKDKSGLRLFDWYETIFPNKNIKEGYWLAQTEEMRTLRETTFVCGYCGRHYFDCATPADGFCRACLGSEHLEKNQLKLLRLVAVCNRDKWKYEDFVPAAVLELYETSQKAARLERLERDRLDEIADIEKRRAAAEVEYKAKIWLIEHGQSTKNVIYYNHTDTFCFGWRDKLTDAQKSELLDLLCEFPYKYELN